MKIDLKSQKGVFVSEALFSVMIIALFSGLILTLSYNIYMSISSLKRMSVATNYITDIFEYIDELYYDDVDGTNITNYCSTLSTKGNIMVNPGDLWNKKGYKIDFDIKSITDEDPSKLDLVKEINVSVSYVLGGKDQTITMSTIKKRENLEIPNSPKFNLLNLGTNEKAYPIKYYNGSWIIANENDTNWYNYENGTWAAVFVIENDELQVGDNILPVKENGEIYIWVPRYAYLNDDIKFLYGTTDSYVKIDSTTNFKTLESIEDTYTKVDNKWITVNEVRLEKLNDVYEYKYLSSL